MTRLTRSALPKMLRGADSHLVIGSAIEDVDVGEDAVDHVIGDPPYDDRTQSRARRGQKTDTALSAPMAIDFAAATTSRRQAWARWMACAARRWALVFSDHESSMEWAGALERAGFGMIYVRPAIWVRTGDEIIEDVKPRKSGAPQFTGDRPAAGHEVIVVAHKGRKMRWNGGGKTAVYTAPVVRGPERAHPTQKPVSLMLQILRDFCDPGETICDPFTGAGTTQVAAKLLGMRSVGVEINARYADYARRRIAAAQPQPKG